MEVAEMKAGLDLVKLMEEHQTGVWRYLRALGADPALADDLTQETFLAVLRKPFEQRSRPETVGYLRVVARNHFFKSLRRSGKQVILPDLEQVSGQWIELAGDGDGALLIEALEKCLEVLEDRPRKALDLRYREAANRKAIAEALEMSEDGVKTLLRRAKARLRKCMERRISDD